MPSQKVRSRSPAGTLPGPSRPRVSSSRPNRVGAASPSPSGRAPSPASRLPPPLASARASRKPSRARRVSTGWDASPSGARSRERRWPPRCDPAARARSRGSSSRGSPPGSAIRAPGTLSPPREGSAHRENASPDRGGSWPPGGTGPRPERESFGEELFQELGIEPGVLDELQCGIELSPEERVQLASLLEGVQGFGLVSRGIGEDAQVEVRIGSRGPELDRLPGRGEGLLVLVLGHEGPALEKSVHGELHVQKPPELHDRCGVVVDMEPNGDVIIDVPPGALLHHEDRRGLLAPAVASGCLTRLESGHEPFSERG